MQESYSHTVFLRPHSSRLEVAFHIAYLPDVGSESSLVLVFSDAQCDFQDHNSRIKRFPIHKETFLHRMTIILKLGAYVIDFSNTAFQSIYFTNLSRILHSDASNTSYILT